MSSAAKLQYQKVNCPECGSLMVLRPSKFANGWYYRCFHFPACRGMHGAHPNGVPLGIPANADTKEWRIKAHAALDPLYASYPKGKERREMRSRAYKWMAYAMGLDINDAHIGQFTAEQCKRLIELIEKDKVSDELRSTR
jgi:ssDNA-binding Zn-finger/Zn-ribbon topoisomerase 1